MFNSELYAATETINWWKDGNLYDTTTCQTGGDITLPTTPTKYGYTFQGWKNAFTRIEYLESTGTQYIDTGYKLSSADEVKIKGEYISIESGSSYLFGIYDSTSGFGINTGSGSSYCVWANSSTSQFLPNITTTGVVYDIEVKLGSLTVNGVTTNFTPTGTFTNNTKTGYLFWANGTSQTKQPVAIYSFQIINAGTVIMDLIPVLDETGTPCMFDKVTHQFFYNQGTGDFIAGPVTNE